MVDGEMVDRELDNFLASGEIVKIAGVYFRNQLGGMQMSASKSAVREVIKWFYPETVNYLAVSEYLGSMSVDEIFFDYFMRAITAPFKDYLLAMALEWKKEQGDK